MPQSNETPATPQKAFEEWAAAKFKVLFDPAGRASAIKNGRRITKISHAAHVNAARKLASVPVGKRMTEANFDALIQKARAITISIS